MARRRRSGPTGRKLLINAREAEESRIAILRGGQLEEYYIERQSLGSTLGNIYKAKVTNVEKSIGAAFVEFGHGRQGFLHVSDLCMEAVSEEAAGLLAGVQAAREEAHDEDVVERKTAAEKADDAEAKAKAEGEAAGDGTGAGDPAAESSAEGRPGAEAPGGPGDTEAAGAPVDAGTASDGVPVATDRPQRAAVTDGERAPAATTDRSLVITVGDQTVTSEPEPAVEAADPAAAEELEGSPDLVDQGDDDDPDGEADLAADDETDEDDDDSDEEDFDEDESEDEDGSWSADDGPRSEGESIDVDEPDEEEPEELGGRRDEEEDEDDEGPSVEELIEVYGPLTASAEEARKEVEAAAAAEREEQRGRRRRRRGRRGGRGAPRNGNDRPEPEKPRAKSGKSSGSGRRRDGREMPAIEQILKKGQEIVVQVIKDGIGTKGPTLTTFLSIPGRFIVLMPGIRKRGVSRKVTDHKERDRLKSLVRDLEAPEEVGFVVRTAGSGCTVEDLQRDLDYLLGLWNRLRSRTREYSAPVLLYQENDLIIRTLRDLYDGEGEIVTDDEPTAQKAREFLTQIMPRCVDNVSLYNDEKPIFSHFGLEAELHRLLNSRIELKSGGSLIIEQTEALVAIDVNSGRYKPTQHKSIDETGFQVNSEAAVEIARQIRLRDLGGVVVIDFIDMRTERHRKQVERIFKDELRHDRARIKVARFSPFGIMELTRQRVRPSLKRSVHQRCPYCLGTGYVPSDETSCLNVVRKIRENLWRPGSVLVVTVRPEVAEAVLNTQKRPLADLEQSSHKQIFVRADHRLTYEDIEVRPMVALPDEFDHRRA